MPVISVGSARLADKAGRISWVKYAPESHMEKGGRRDLGKVTTASTGGLCRLQGGHSFPQLRSAHQSRQDVVMSYLLSQVYLVGGQSW